MWSELDWEVGSMKDSWAMLWKVYGGGICKYFDTQVSKQS